MTAGAPKRFAVLISGRGSNLQALIDAAEQPGFPARPALVLSNEPEAGGLARARAAGVAADCVPHRDFAQRNDFEAALQARLDAAAAELVCLAGFMRVLSPAFVERWRGRLLNVHPSLLPAFPGLDTHARALRAGVRLHGCTVHFVDASLDGGPILGQAAVPVAPDDDEARLAARVLAAEHLLYPRCLALVAAGALRLEGERLRWDASASTGLLINPHA